MKKILIIVGAIILLVAVYQIQQAREQAAFERNLAEQRAAGERKAQEMTDMLQKIETQARERQNADSLDRIATELERKNR